MTVLSLVSIPPLSPPSCMQSPPEQEELKKGRGQLTLSSPPTLAAHKWFLFMKQRFPGIAGSICSSYDAPANATLSEWLDYYPDNWVTRTLLGSRYLYGKDLPLGEAELQQAKNRLEAFTTVLVLEELDLGLRVLGEVLGWEEREGEETEMAAGAPQANVARGGRTDSTRELDDLTWQKAASTIRLDLEVYEHARALFARQAERLGLANATDLAR